MTEPTSQETATETSVPHYATLRERHEAYQAEVKAFAQAELTEPSYTREELVASANRKLELPEGPASEYMVNYTLLLLKTALDPNITVV